MPVTADELNKSCQTDFPVLATKGGLTARKLIKELKTIAFSDLSDHLEIADGGELRFKTFGEQGLKRRAIKSIKEKTTITESQDGQRINKTSTVEFTLYDKLDAIKTAMALHGMTKPERREHVFPDKNGVPQNLAGAFGDVERSARLIYLLEQVEKRAQEGIK